MPQGQAGGSLYSALQQEIQRATREDLAPDRFLSALTEVNGSPVAIVSNTGSERMEEVLESPQHDDGTPMTPTEVQQYDIAPVSGYEEVTGPVTIYYQSESDVTQAAADSHNTGQLRFQLVGDTDDSIVPGSVLFRLGGREHFDRDGLLYHSITGTGGATECGSIDYDSRYVTLESWPDGADPAVEVLSCATAASRLATSNLCFRTPGAPLRPQSLTVTATATDGEVITVTADGDGIMSGPRVSGYVNYESGIVDLWFTTDDTDTTGASDVYVWASTARYNAIMYAFMPLDAEIIGIDPVRLPSDGRVPIYRKGDVVVITHTDETDLGTPTAGQVVSLARDHQASIEVVDENGVALESAQYSVDLATGTITFADPLTLQDAKTNALTTPLTARDRIEHMTLLNEVEITGELSYIAPSGHTFPAGSNVCSALVWGDVSARAYDFFTQRTWDSGSPNWSNQRIGDDTTAGYNLVDNPIEVANRGAITERWALIFTSSTTFNIAAETLGIIGTGNASTDVSPINPNTNFPYFVLRAAGFGSGWAAGNVIRFDTRGCLAPIWLARTVLSGGATEDDDRFVLQVRGDAD